MTSYNLLFVCCCAPARVARNAVAKVPAPAAAAHRPTATAPAEAAKRSRRPTAASVRRTPAFSPFAPLRIPITPAQARSARFLQAPRNILLLRTDDRADKRAGDLAQRPPVVSIGIPSPADVKRVIAICHHVEAGDRAETLDQRLHEVEPGQRVSRALDEEHRHADPWQMRSPEVTGHTGAME